MRSVRSAEPVAMKFPKGLHAMVRMLWGLLKGLPSDRWAQGRTYESLGRERLGHDMSGL